MLVVLRSIFASTEVTLHALRLSEVRPLKEALQGALAAQMQAHDGVRHGLARVIGVASLYLHEFRLPRSHHWC